MTLRKKGALPPTATGGYDVSHPYGT